MDGLYLLSKFIIIKIYMVSYQKFAPFYDLVMGDRQEECVFIEKLVRCHHSKAKTVLELGCGTGEFLKYFSNQGFRVAGVDLSKEMLGIAREKLPGIKLYQQDMSIFSLSEKFDVIVCLFDSINHLINYTDWESMFARAVEHLNEGGVFIFDINTLEELEKMSNSEPFSRKFDNKKVTMKITPRGKIYNWNVKISELDNGEEKIISVEDIQEISFPIAQISESLLKNFSKVNTFDRSGGKPSKTAQRVYFVCEDMNR